MLTSLWVGRVWLVSAVRLCFRLRAGVKSVPRVLIQSSGRKEQGYGRFWPPPGMHIRASPTLQVNFKSLFANH